MNITILPDLPDSEANPDRLAAIQNELDQIRYEDGVDVNITPAELAALEDRGFVYDFATGQVKLNTEEINLN